MGFGDWYLPERSRAVTTKNWHGMPPSLPHTVPSWQQPAWFKTALVQVHPRKGAPNRRSRNGSQPVLEHKHSIFYVHKCEKEETEVNGDRAGNGAHTRHLLWWHVPPTIRLQTEPPVSKPGRARTKAPLGLGGLCVEEPLPTLAESQARLLSFLLPLQQHLCSPEHQEKWVLLLGPICHCPPPQKAQSGGQDRRT